MSVRAELDCDEVVRNFPGAPRPYVQVFSHVKPEIAGIPDRLYFLRGVCLYWEVKQGRDRLTLDQFEFLERCYQAGNLVGAGDAVALRGLIYGLVPSEWRAPGWQMVLDLKARGFRDE